MANVYPKTDASNRWMNRKGLTLVEAAVVMGIIGVIIVLLFPAVQRLRELANTMECQNHLRQIGQGFLEHHKTHRYFPSGGWEWWNAPTYVDGKPAIGREQKAGWGFQVLPFVEGEAAWKGGEGATDLERTLAAIGTANKLFFCPTRRGPQTIRFSEPEYLGGREATHALCDYAASNWEKTGAVTMMEPMRMGDITDGTAYTLLVAEKRLNLALLGQRQSDDFLGYTGAWSTDPIRSTDRAPAPDFYGSEGQDGEARFGSSHRGLIHAIFADGSERRLSFDIDAGVFKKLGNKSDSTQSKAK
jgi:hypothetical protein